jgi:hypothetical protein
MHSPARILTTALTAILIATSLLAQTDPRYTSWLTNPSGNYARLYASSAAQASGTAATTWSRGQGMQATPTYAGVGQVSYSTNWVYIRGSGLGFHTMGPWYLNEAKTQNFPNYPANTNVLYRIPRTPSVPATKTLTNIGAIGYFVDGVAMFDYTDTFSYSTSNAADASPVAGFAGRGDGVWIRDAYVNEGVTFDPAFAHQAGDQYHYHANAPALRYQLGDHVDYNSTTKVYTESTTTVSTHSPIVAWSRDGYPVYGPYGHATATEASSGIRRMISGYVKRDGTNGTTNLSTTGRTTLPAWAALAQNRSATLAGNVYGPAVNTTYVLGHYLEDYDYLGNLGKTQGTDFDLDQYNGRLCVTPEFPNGTYAYFLSIETDGTPKFPYIVGRWFYGSPTGAAVTSITESVTEYVRGAPTASLQISTTAKASAIDVSWNSVEGATYTVESSADQTNWSPLSSAVASSGITTSYSATTASYYRVTLSAISSYDSDGTVGTPVGLSASVSAPTIGTAPTISTNPSDVATTVGSTVMFIVTATGTGPLTYAWFKNGGAITGATSATYTLASFTAAEVGSYTVTVTNTSGSATSSAATLAIDAGTVVDPGDGGPGDGGPPTDGEGPRNHITNLSTRTAVGGAAGTPVMGLVVAGDGTAPVLLRAVGPTLATFGVEGVLADPILNLIASSTSTTTASNDNWGTATNLTELTTASTALGAFSLTSGSADAAWLGNLAAGAYTAPISGGTSSGIVLLEAYDASRGLPTAELVNASTRAFVGSGDSTLVAGFVLSGPGTRRLLLRAIGPTLSSFGVTDAIPDPKITLYSGETVVETNDNWSNTGGTIAAASSGAGAFALTTGSADSAIIVDLLAGTYTLVVQGVGDESGTALVEIYLID